MNSLWKKPRLSLECTASCLSLPCAGIVGVPTHQARAFFRTSRVWVLK